jgi:uncharacterized membrane protein YeaQ/YmgE (transglycosylase-associated protein family)
VSFDVLSEINWVAVVVAGLVYFAIGAVWYSPLLFSGAWQRSIGWDSQRPPPEMSVMTYVVPLIAYLVMAAAVGIIAEATASDTLAEGLILGLVVGIGLSLMHTLVDASFDPNKPEPWTWFAINGTYHTLGLVIVALIVAFWQ